MKSLFKSYYSEVVIALIISWDNSVGPQSETLKETMTSSHKTDYSETRSPLIKKQKYNWMHLLLSRYLSENEAFPKDLTHSCNLHSRKMWLKENSF